MTDPFASETVEETITITGLEEIEDSFVIEPGDYEVRVTDFVQDVTAAGDPTLIWDLEITDDGRYAGRTLKMWTPLSDKAKFKMKEVVVALGIYDGTGDLELNRSTTVGKVGLARIVTKDWKGTQRSLIDSLQKLERGNGAMLGDNTLNDNIPF